MTDVTIIVTAHDRPSMLRECLRSIPVQADVVVVDDASSDPYAGARDFLGSRVRWVYLRQHVGYAEARLVGLEHVETPFLAFLDDDDVLLGRWLSVSLSKMRRGFDVVAASYYETDADLRNRRAVVLPPATLEGLRAGNVPVNDGALIRRSALDGITWHPERDTVMMMSLWLALAAGGRRFGSLAEPLWLHRLHGANMSAGIGEADAAFRAEAISEHGT